MIPFISRYLDGGFWFDTLFLSIFLKDIFFIVFLNIFVLALSGFKKIIHECTGGDNLFFFDRMADPRQHGLQGLYEAADTYPFHWDMTVLMTSAKGGRGAGDGEATTD